MIKCIAVDDEHFCIENLKYLIAQFPLKLELLETFKDAEKALQYLENNPVDLIFSDIQMNGMSGFEFAKRVSDATKVIFTTAHKDYGADSYEYNAIDFLQKPIDLDRFKKAIDKISTTTINSDGTFFVKDGYKKIHLNVNDVAYIQLTTGYCHFYKPNKKEAVFSIIPLNELEKQLKPFNFYRIHNSHMVHMQYIASYDVNYVDINLGHEIKHLPISSSYRAEFLKAMPLLGK